MCLRWDAKLGVPVISPVHARSDPLMKRQPKHCRVARSKICVFVNSIPAPAFAETPLSSNFNTSRNLTHPPQVVFPRPQSFELHPNPLGLSSLCMVSRLAVRETWFIPLLRPSITSLAVNRMFTADTLFAYTIVCDLIFRNLPVSVEILVRHRC